MPGRAGGVAPGGRSATYTESTLYPFFFAISNVTYFLSGEVLPENTPVFDFNRQALRLRRLASSGDRLGVASSYESGRRRVDGKTAIRGRTLCYTKARSAEVRMWGSEFTYTHITSLLAPPVLRLARLNLPVGTFEFANSIRPFSSTRPET